MKIKYEFANETVEVEVEEKWGNIVVDLDRQEYNNNHKNTRRHCSFDAFNLDGTLFASPQAVENEFELRERVNAALNSLNPYHKFLITEHYINGYSVKEIAEKLGVSETAVYRALRRSEKFFRKIFK